MLFCNLNFSGNYNGEGNKASENEYLVFASDATERHRRSLSISSFSSVHTLYPILYNQSMYVQLHSDLNVTTTGGSTQYSLQIICPYLFLIVKAKREASLRCSTSLHFSFCCPLVNGLIFLLCCHSPRGAEVKMRDAKQQQKRDKMC